MPGEIDILRKILPQLASRRDISCGPGDDCAVLAVETEQEIVVTVDQLIRNIHFTDDTSPEAAGAKLMKRNLSDIAAMGAVPCWAFIATATAGVDAGWLTDFVLAAARCGEAWQTAVAGGDIASLPHPGVSASLTLIGTLPKGTAILRSGAKAGDNIYVTGTIGNSFASGHHLNFTPRLAEGQYLRGKASAAMDISDGLLLDAMRMAEASGVDFLIDISAVPLRSGAKLPEALSDGEDYELLFTAPAGAVKDYPPDLMPITCIGTVQPAAEKCGRVLDKSGKLFDLKKVGYEH